MIMERIRGNTSQSKTSEYLDYYRRFNWATNLWEHRTIKERSYDDDLNEYKNADAMISRSPWGQMTRGLCKCDSPGLLHLALIDLLLFYSGFQNRIFVYGSPQHAPLGIFTTNGTMLFIESELQLLYKQYSPKYGDTTYVQYKSAQAVL